MCAFGGAGLSSSAALECVVAVYLADRLALICMLKRKTKNRAKLAALCVRAEMRLQVLLPGGMDQSARMRCEDNKALVLGL